MRWDVANDPLIADPSFIVDVATLPVEGAVAIPPWPGWYWPTASDSINARWNPVAPSAAEKVELAFGIPGFADAVSKAYGVLSCSHLPVCAIDSQCAAGERCTRRAGAWLGSPGHCIPEWWGIDHGWAAAAILEPAPISAVQRAGHTFEVHDIKALLTLMYAGSLPIKFVGRRSNGAVTAVDLRGRPLDPIDRDIDPGALHLIIANQVGLKGQSVVVDLQINNLVWNQPVRSFRVTNAIEGQLLEITESMAARALGLDVAFQVVLGPTLLAHDERRSGSFTALVDGDFVVGTSGTGDVDLYVKIGGPASENDADRAGRGDDSFERCRLHATAGSVIHWTAIGYQSNSCVQVWIGVPTGVPATYTANPDASRFFLVDLDLRWVTNADPAATPRPIDDYTRTLPLRYVLEADSAGAIIGGEWIGESLRYHPDFLWWPQSLPQNKSFGGLTYDTVRALLLESVA
jgi:hypothetical protein